MFSCRCAACPSRGALPQPAARLLRVLPRRTRAGSVSREAEPSGEPGPPLRVGVGGRAGAPGWPRSYREPRLGEAVRPVRGRAQLPTGLSPSAPLPKSWGVRAGGGWCSAGTSRLAPEGHGLPRKLQLRYQFLYIF